MPRLLHLMQRDVDTNCEGLEDYRFNWKRLENNALPEMFTLGRVKRLDLPLEWQGEIKVVLQTMTNFRARNIDLPPVMHEFWRLYFRGTVFHCSKVQSPHTNFLHTCFIFYTIT